jgi:hypothetical protein
MEKNRRGNVKNVLLRQQFKNATWKQVMQGDINASLEDAMSSCIGYVIP